MNKLAICLDKIDIRKGRDCLRRVLLGEEVPVCVYVYMCVCVYVYMCVCVYGFMSVEERVSIICIHTVLGCMCMCMCMCMCIHSYVPGLGLLGQSLQLLLLGSPLPHSLLDRLVLLLAVDDLRLAGGGLDVGDGDVQLLAQDAAVHLCHIIFMSERV
jgi:hypothetical protein